MVMMLITRVVMVTSPKSVKQSRNYATSGQVCQLFSAVSRVPSLSNVHPSDCPPVISQFTSGRWETFLCDEGDMSSSVYLCLEHMKVTSHDQKIWSAEITWHNSFLLFPLNHYSTPYIDGKIRKVWFFAPGCLNNFTQGWSFSVILAWDNQKGTFLTHFFNFGHEGAPNVTKITYNMIIWWENSPRKKIGAVSFTGGWAILFKKKKYGPFHWSCSSTYMH